jgi:hypothetical protein
VVFEEKKVTTYGQTIKISGSIPALGNWDTSSAVNLLASNYTSTNPEWFVALGLAPGTVAQYKFILVGSGGDIAWEADPNHTITVTGSCATATTVAAAWQT